MEKSSVATSESPAIELKINGDLTVKGWRKPSVMATSSSKDDLTLEQDNDHVYITCRNDCNVYVPSGANLEKIQVNGNGSIKAVEGEINLEEINGNLTLRGLGSTRAATINGNLIAKNISGDLGLTSVKGNATIKDIQGKFSVSGSINGNLRLEDVDDNASAMVDGNINLYLDPSPGNEYSFSAKGNLACFLPPDTSTQIDVPKASNLLIKMPDVDIPDHQQTPFSWVLGEGDAKLTLSANGNVKLGWQFLEWGPGGFELDIEKDFENLSTEIEDQVLQQFEAQMEMWEVEMESQMENLVANLGSIGISSEVSDRIAEKTHKAKERADRHAHEKMMRTHEKMQRKLEAARRRAERKTKSAERAARDRRRRPESYQWSPPKPESVQEPVSDQERLLVLEMLEQGKISIDEAEQLLAALEGK
jgi:hypothetical protein